MPETRLTAEESHRLASLAELERDIQSAPPSPSKSEMLAGVRNLEALYRDCIRSDAEMAKWKEELEQRRQKERRELFFIIPFFLSACVLALATVYNAIISGATPGRGGHTIVRDIEPFAYWSIVGGLSLFVAVFSSLCIYAIWHWLRKRKVEK